MKKFLTLLVACIALAAWTTSAWAVTLSYTVDVGAGFGNPVVINSASGNSALGIFPIAGTLNDVGDTFQPLDIATWLLDTDVVAGPGETITDPNRLYTIRVSDGLGNSADWTQTVSFNLTGIMAGSLSGGTPTNVGPTQGTQMVGSVPVTIEFQSIDDLGVPVATPIAALTNPNTLLPYGYESLGAKTDQIKSVPEPGTLALFVGVAVPASLFGLRRSRKAR